MPAPKQRAEERLLLNEERFELLVKSVRDYAIFLLNPAGFISSWNEGARRIKGYEEHEIIGKHFSIFYPEDDVAAGKPAYELEVAAEVGRFEDEGPRIRKDGTTFWANVVITALREDDGRLVGYAKVTRDLTERRASEQRAIEDARRVAEAEASNRAKSEFLAAMSHELRTPLNAIGGYAELLALGVAGDMSEQQRDFINRIVAGQQHLLAIITDLLNYSRLEAGHVSYDKERLGLRSIVDSVLAMVAPQASRKRITISQDACDAAAFAWADRLKVEQIVLNLISNAVKFSPAGSVVHVQCVSDDRVGRISVRDSGPGIPESKHAAIFEPFVQLGRTLSSEHEGTGLGLAISRDLARAMGGDVTLESREGAGAAFTLELPTSPD